MKNFNRAYRNALMCEETLDSILYALQHDDDAFSDLRDSEMMELAKALSALNRFLASVENHF